MRRALLAAVLVLPLAACGGGSKHSSGSSSTPIAAVKAAALKTASAGSETMTLRANVQAAGQSIAMSGTGAFDTKAARGTMRIAFKAGPIAASIEEVITGTTIYVKSPLFASNLPSGKTWMEIDVSKLHVSGLDIQSLLVQDPATELKNLQLLKSATKVGSEQLGGVSTTHYRAQIDTSKLPASAAGLSSYDVWVGDDGYIHQLQVAGSNPKVALTIGLSNFGAKVDAAPPPASQVYVTKNIPGLGGLTS